MNDKTNEERAAIVARLGLTVEAIFIPFSQSRNKAEESPSLNWRVTVLKNGRPVLDTDYSAGSGHCHAAKASIRVLGGHDSLMRSEAIAWECENGFPAAVGEGSGGRFRRGPALMPNALDVIASLAMDSDVIDAGGFEDWARNLGFDPDSRKAEAIYRACLETALKLRAALGDDGLAALRNAFEGY